MSILALVVIALSIFVLLKVGRLLFDPPAWRHLTLAELEREMTRIAHEWANSVEPREASEKVHQEIQP